MAYNADPLQHTNCTQAVATYRQDERLNQLGWSLIGLGQNQSLPERLLGVTTLLPVVDWVGRGLGLVGDAVRGLTAARDVAEGGTALARGSVLEGLLPGFAGCEMGDYALSQGRALIPQRQTFTCVAASCLMVASDVGAELDSEYEIAEALGTTEDGALLDAIPGVLSEYGVAGAEYRTGLTIDDLASAVGAGRSAIASIRPTSTLASDGFHVLVVDAIQDGRVFIRDPLPIREGQAYSVSVSDFVAAFRGTGVIFR